jgi:hypothetical protein
VVAAGAASVATRTPRLAPLVWAIGLAAILLLVVALAGRWSGLIPWAVALAGAEYAAFLLLRKGSIDAYAPFYGGGLLLAAELGYWSLERRVPPAEDEHLTSRRASLLVASVLAAGGVGGMILTMAELSLSGGLGLEILGVAAAVAALGLVGLLARREA